MAYKTILTCLTSEFATRNLMPAACGLARRFDAHLTGLHTREAFVPYPGIALTADDMLISSFNKRVLEEDDRIATEFKDAAERSGCTAEWRSRPAKSANANREILESACRSDLVLTLLPDPEHERYDQHGVQKDLIVYSGRPVLLLPENWGERAIGTRVQVAWNATRESARALHGGMPFLQEAEFTQILTVEAARRDAVQDSVEGHEIARVLSRHGVSPEVRHVKAGASEIGTCILAEAAHQQCDLVIMGAYGHSRLHRIAFGDASGHVLGEARLPVLFCG